MRRSCAPEEPRDEGPPGPGGVRLGHEGDAGRCDRRGPQVRRGDERLVVGSAHERPSVVAAGDDRVELVVAARPVEAARPVVGHPQPPRARLPGQPLGVAKALRDDLGGDGSSEVRAGRDAEDAAVEGARVLSAVAVAAIPRPDVEGAVGADPHAAGVVDGAGAHVAQDHRILRQAVAREAPALHLHLVADGRGQVHEGPGRGEGGVDREPEQPAVAGRVHGHLGGRLGDAAGRRASRCARGRAARTPAPGRRAGTRCPTGSGARG